MQVRPQSSIAAKLYVIFALLATMTVGLPRSRSIAHTATLR